MKYSVHPGQILQMHYIEPLQMNHTKFAKKLGVYKTTVSRLVNGDSSISSEMAVRLEAVTGKPAVYWLNVQRDYDLNEKRRTVDLSNITKVDFSKIFEGVAKFFGKDGDNSRFSTDSETPETSNPVVNYSKIENLCNLYSVIFDKETKPILSHEVLNFILKMWYKSLSDISRGDYTQTTKLFLVDMTVEMVKLAQSKSAKCDWHYIQSKADIGQHDTDNQLKLRKERLLAETVSNDGILIGGFSEWFIRPITNGSFNIEQFSVQDLAEIFNQEKLQYFFPLVVASSDLTDGEAIQFLKHIGHDVENSAHGWDTENFHYTLNVFATRSFLTLPSCYLVISGKFFVFPCDLDILLALEKSSRIQNSSSSFVAFNESSVCIMQNAAEKDKVILDLKSLHIHMSKDEYFELCKTLIEKISSDDIKPTIDILKMWKGCL